MTRKCCHLSNYWHTRYGILQIRIIGGSFKLASGSPEIVYFQKITSQKTILIREYPKPYQPAFKCVEYKIEWRWLRR